MNNIPAVESQMYNYPRSIYHMSLRHDNNCSPVKNNLEVKELRVVYENSRYIVIECEDEETVLIDKTSDLIYEVSEFPSIFNAPEAKFLTFWRSTQGLYFNGNPMVHPEWHDISSKILLYGPLTEICSRTMSTIKNYSPLKDNQIEGECQDAIVQVANVISKHISTEVIQFIERTRKSVPDLLSMMNLSYAIIQILKHYKFT